MLEELLSKKKKDMFDILNSRLKKNTINMILLSRKMGELDDLIIKLGSDNKEKRKAIIELIKLAKRALPVICDNANYFYEVFNEMDTHYTEEEILSFVRSKGLDENEFISNYWANKVLVAKTLSVLGILSYENISLEELNENIVSFNHNKNISFIKESFSNIRGISINEILNLIQKRSDEEFSLDSFQKDALERYHHKYMKKYIYPFVTEEKSLVYEKNETALTRAYKLGSKKIIE